eukprot:TRINITY_DN14409_c0_g1_i1.p4 TRINITY_DN14409_c0_g1~~TRINITY_DN14409_c0_g1_i1.p4  ORF type:complete len:138 (+),score=30.21 TRINITY_DN14409_c0_g1_i1:209-622(+)
MATAEVYDPESNSWAVLPELPEPRDSVGVAVHEDQLFVFGGCSAEGEALGSGYRLREGCWEALPEMGVPREDFALVTAGACLLAVGGGSTHSGHVASCEVLHLDRMEEGWHSGPEMARFLVWWWWRDTGGASLCCLL